MENRPVIFTITKVHDNEYRMYTKDSRCSSDPSPNIKAADLFCVMSDLTTGFNEQGVAVLFEVEE